MSLEDVEQQQQLDEGQGLAPLPGAEATEDLGHRLGPLHLPPDRLLHPGGHLPGGIGVDVEGVHRLAVLVADELQVHGLAGVVGENAAEAGLGDGGTQQHIGRERIVGRLLALLDGSEAHDDVGMRPLRADEGRRLGFPPHHLLRHLLLGVAPLACVPGHLPPPPDLLRGVQVHGPLGDHEFRRLHQHRPVEGAGLVVVDRLEDRLAQRQQLQVLLHDVDVVAGRVERRERERLSLLAVVPVVVVDADGGDPIGAERVDQPLRQGRLA